MNIISTPTTTIDGAFILFFTLMLFIRVRILILILKKFHMDQ